MVTTCQGKRLKLNINNVTLKTQIKIPKLIKKRSLI